MYNYLVGDTFHRSHIFTAYLLYTYVNEKSERTKYQKFMHADTAAFEAPKDSQTMQKMRGRSASYPGGRDGIHMDWSHIDLCEEFLISD